MIPNLYFNTRGNQGSESLKFTPNLQGMWYWNQDSDAGALFLVYHTPFVLSCLLSPREFLWQMDFHSFTLREDSLNGNNLEVISFPEKSFLFSLLYPRSWQRSQRNPGGNMMKWRPQTLESDNTMQLSTLLFGAKWIKFNNAKNFIHTVGQ